MIMMRNSLDIIDEHIIIRETVGYDAIKNIDPMDIPEIISFLKVVHNYIKMKNIEENPFKNKQ
jgi:hypothetical protein